MAPVTHVEISDENVDLRPYLKCSEASGPRGVKLLPPPGPAPAAAVSPAAPPAGSTTWCSTMSSRAATAGWCCSQSMGASRSDRALEVVAVVDAEPTRGGTLTEGVPGATVLAGVLHPAAPSLTSPLAGACDLVPEAVGCGRAAVDGWEVGCGRAAVDGWEVGCGRAAVDGWEVGCGRAAMRMRSRRSCPNTSSRFRPG